MNVNKIIKNKEDEILFYKKRIPEIEHEILELKKIFIDNDYKYFINYNLTESEIKVLKLVQEGLTNKEISNILFYTINTIKKYVSNILHITGCKDRYKLISMRYKNG